MIARTHRIVGEGYALREDIVGATKAGAISYLFAVATAVVIYLVIGGFAALMSATIWAFTLSLQGFGAAVMVSWRRALIFATISALNGAALAGTLLLLARIATIAGVHAGYVLRLVS